MKYCLTKKYLKIILATILLLSFLSFDNLYAQKRIIIGVKYTPSLSFSSFADNQYVSHAWDLNPALRLKWWSGSEFPFIRIDNISIGKKLYFGFEVGRGSIGVGYHRTITANYTGGKKWSNKLVGGSYTEFSSYPINFYFFTKPSNKNYRRYLKIGTTIINNNWEGTSFGLTKFVYPDADPYSQDTLFETSITHLKPLTKFTINLGIGIEKIFWKNVFLDLGLVYNQGFSSLRTTDVQYTIDGVTFNNKILSKGTYLGLELCLGINPFFFK